MEQHIVPFNSYIYQLIFQIVGINNIRLPDFVQKWVCTKNVPLDAPFKIKYYFGTPFYSILLIFQKVDVMNKSNV